MPRVRKRCSVCRISLSSGSVCDMCQRSLFQIDEVLNMYVRSELPEWLEDAVSEFHWLFDWYPRAKAFLNVAEDATYQIVIDGAESIDIDDLREFGYSRIPRNTIITVLREARVIEVSGNDIVAGPLIEVLRQKRWEGYALNTPEFQNAVQILHGVLTVALTKSLIENTNYLPRKVLAVFNIISLKMMHKGRIDSVTQDEFAFATQMLPGRAHRALKRSICGLSSGYSKIVQDVDDEGILELKPEIISYVEQMRERFRDRGRERIRQ